MRAPFKPLLLLAIAALAPSGARAHFQLLIPSDNVVEANEPRTLDLDLLFAHPFDLAGMDMARPLRFGVVSDGETVELMQSLQSTLKLDHQAWQARYRLTRPGDYVFFVEPEPYWEPAEERYIVHCAKTVVNAFGLEEGWDAEAGLKTEIIPLTRPYGLYAGNLFSGVVKVNGRPAPNVMVEVEFYNEDKNHEAPTASHATQTVKADASGVFHFAMPWAGWWGFAALSDSDETIERDGAPQPVEIGAVLWIRADEPATLKTSTAR